MAADVLYVTFDGVLQPLGFSQVVRVVAGLGERGLRYHLLSLERPQDVSNDRLRKSVEEALGRAGVRWTHLDAASMGTPRLAIQAAARATLQVAAIARHEGVKLIHARGYHSAVVACSLKRLLDLPYLFDARGYWIEERARPSGWFSSPVAYSMGKFMEQLLFRGADAVVTLTELQAIDIASGIFGPPPRMLEVIPTCADYDAFYLRDTRPAQPEQSPSVPDLVQNRLAGKTVMGIVGALNGSYFVKESLSFAKIATELSPAVHLLVLSQQQTEYQAALGAAGIPAERFTIASAEHSTVPDWLQWIDWGLLLLPETAAKRASMPTKLAEFFAAGVRPLFLGCNSEATRWVARAGSGYILPSIDATELRAAARFVVDSVVDYGKLYTAREVTRSHFGLNSCLDRYTTVVRGVLS